MKGKAEEFNQTKAPDIASDVHDQLVQQNEKSLVELKRMKPI